VKSVAVDQSGQALPVSSPSGAAGALRRCAASFWLGALFFCARRAPWFARAVRPVFVRLTTAASKHIQRAGALNARRIYGAQLSDRDCLRFARRVTGNFYDFVADVGLAMRWTPEQMLRQVESIEGHEKYVAARALKRGAIVVTAHMGSFEVGLAALRNMENKVHVVFRRDAEDRFDQIRQVLRQRLGVIEAPVEEGWGLWMRLRDCLMADEVVVIQGDRVMPGQKGQRVPFLGNHLMLPTGPVKLAAASGAPIIPVFSVRQGDGKMKLVVEDAIDVQAPGEDPMLRLAKVLEKHVAANADQWLVLQPAFCEDVEPALGDE
jgi:lauroyl/myristoyl acyltransferase